MNFVDLLIPKSGDGDEENRCYSITTGIVKKNWDNDHPGMVQVELIFGESGKATTGWLRVMQPYAGPSYGTYFLPEVDTEVIVGFNNGDINGGIVLGCLWNKVDTLPENTANEENSIKSIQTKSGHQILFDETKDKERVEIITSKKLDILLDDKNNKIIIQDQKQENSLEIDGNNGEITINAGKKISLRANGSDVMVLDGSGNKASVKTGTIELNGSQKLDMQGSSTLLQGNSLSVSAKGNCSIESSAMMQIKGTMVKLN